LRQEILQEKGDLTLKDEEDLLENIRKLDEDHIQIRPSNIDSYGQQILISKLFTLISTRYHPIVFAAKSNIPFIIPFISIYYEHKAEGFAQKTGLTEFSVPVEKINADEIINMFEILERDRDTIVERLRTVNPLLKKNQE